jgi:hypothetical protein
VRGNEDVRTPSTQDLVLALDPHHLSEPISQDDCRDWFRSDAGMGLICKLSFRHHVFHLT